MRVTNEGHAHSVLSDPTGLGGTTPLPDPEDLPGDEGGGSLDDPPAVAWVHVMVNNPAIVTTTGEAVYVPLTGSDGMPIMAVVPMT